MLKLKNASKQSKLINLRLWNKGEWKHGSIVQGYKGKYRIDISIVF